MDQNSLEEAFDIAFFYIKEEDIGNTHTTQFSDLL